MKLILLAKPAVSIKDEQSFRNLIRKGFFHRRKTLVNVLNKELEVPRQKIAQFLVELQVSPDIRAEKLTLQQWAWLSDQIEKTHTSA